MGAWVELYPICFGFLEFMLTLQSPLPSGDKLYCCDMKSTLNTTVCVLHFYFPAVILTRAVLRLVWPFDGIVQN